MSAKASPRPRSCRGASRPATASRVNDVLVEIETAKSLVELPSPFAGTVGELLVAEGDTVNVGAPIITIASRRMPRPRPPSGRPSTASPPSRSRGRGRGARRLRHRRSRAVAAPQARRSAQRSGSRHPSAIIAKPPIRKLARDLGVELAAVAPERPRRRGDPRRRRAARVAGQRVPQHRDAGVGRRARGDDPGRRAGAARGRHPAPRRSRRRRPPPDAAARGDDRRSRACARPSRRRWCSSAYSAPHVSVWTDVDAIAHDGARQAAQGLAGLRRHQGLAAAHHGARRDLGRAAHADGQRRVGRRRRRRRRSTCAATSTSASPRRRRAACWCRTSRTRRTSTCASWPARSRSSR